MKTAKQQLAIAKKHLGQGGAKFRKYCGLPNGSAWCDAFVTYIFNEAGNASLFCNGKKQTYCPTTIKLLAKDLAQVPMYLAMPSDVIFFDWDRNGTPNHIGFVRERVSTSAIRTIEGNTSNKVMNKTRPAKYVQAIFRPHFKPAGELKQHKLTVDGKFGYKSIYMLQVALGMKPTGILTKETVKFLQKKAKATEDGVWGRGTSKAVQKMTKAHVDGDFGPNSVKSLQKWINGIVYPSTAEKPPQPAPEPQKPTPADKAVEWGRAIIKDGSYGYKYWKDNDKKTHQCPVCHPKLTGKYHAWQCIGFVTACWYHGAGLRCIKCECNGLGTNNFFTKVTEDSWKKRNGKDWKMITNGESKGGKSIDQSKLKKGDILICYDEKGVFHHIVMYTGNGMYMDCTHGKIPHCGERPMSKLSKKHITRAFRYTGE